MKLVGIEEVDLAKAKKVLEMLYKLSKISDEFGNGIKVYNTAGEPVADCRYNQGWGDGWLECVYFVTMKKDDLYYNWICYVDKDDGYRSYAGVYQFKCKDIQLSKNLEVFNLNCSYTENTKKVTKAKQKGWDDIIINTNLKVKCKHKIIFHSFTDWTDGYYPVGVLKNDLTKLELKYDNIAG